jgi:hypothetical protein
MKKFALIFVSVSLLCSCKNDKEEDLPQSPQAYISVSLLFECDGASLVKDQFNYTNAAGNNYSLNRLQFFLADFTFVRPDSTEVKSDEVFLIDYFAGKNRSFSITKIPQGNYIGLKFCIGLPPSQNLTGALPNTLENVNMAWPDMMGGGYHFLKMEGQFKFSGNVYGYALHLGKNAHLVKVESVKAWNHSGNASSLIMKVNINEWFRTPHVYDLNTDGNYTMGSDSLMLKIAENGVDVITLQ